MANLDYAIHGSASTYRNYGCRCADCRTAHRAYKNAGKAAHRAAGLCPECAAPADGKGGRCRYHYARVIFSTTNRARKQKGLEPLTFEVFQSLQVPS